MNKLQLFTFILNLLNPVIMVTAAICVYRILRRALPFARNYRKYDRLSNRYLALATALNANPAWAHPEGNPDWIPEQAEVTGTMVSLAYTITHHEYQSASERTSLPTFKEKDLLRAADAFVTAVENGGEHVGYPAPELADILIEDGFAPISPESVSPDDTLNADSFYRHHMGTLVYALQNGTPLPPAGAYMKYIQARVTGAIYV